MFGGLPGGRREQSRSPGTLLTAVVAGLATIGLLVIIVVHKDSQFPTARDCPSATLVNSVLGTHVASPTAVSESDVLGCFYQQGTDDQAVSVSFAAPTSTDHPCRRRPRLEVSGDVACVVTGTPGTKRSGASLAVVAGKLEDQFSTDARKVSLSRLERLAGKVLAARPPPVRPVVPPTSATMGVGDR